MNNLYKKQVALLIRIMPSVYRIKDFAVHGGLQPNSIDQTDALENQFNGMSNVEFSYSDFEKARTNLITEVNEALTEVDKDFILSFEEGMPDWDKCCAGDLSNYPSVKWKLQNIIKLKKNNPQKHQQGINQLKKFLGR
jgi:hypothetical protein